MLRPILSAYLSSPVQPTASPCLPGHRHPVKELHSVERRSSEVTVNLVTVDGPVYHVVSIYLCRAESISRFDDRYAEAKFLKSGVWDKVLEGSTLISGRYPSFLTKQYRKGERKLPCQNRLNSFRPIRFDRTPTCDRHRHRR